MPTTTPRVAVLGAAFSRFHGLEPDRFADLASLQVAPAYDVLLLDLPGVSAGQLLRSLRLDRQYRFALIYCCQDQDPWCLALGDGHPPADLAACRTFPLAGRIAHRSWNLTV